MDKTLIFLNDIRDNLEHVDYDMIYQSIADMPDKYYATAIVKAGEYIDRVRINDDNFKECTCVDEIGYIKDKNILEKCVDFGRANLPKQAVFYGAIESPEIRQQRVVAYFETTKLLKELGAYTKIGKPIPPQYDNVCEISTISRWRVKKDMEIHEVIFSDEALKASSTARASFEYQRQYYEHLPVAEHVRQQGQFFGNEFARNDIKQNQGYKYKISAAYANYVWNNTVLKGLTYPSVASEYKGQNIALLPELVDEYLDLEIIACQKFERKNGKGLPMSIFKYSMDFGEDGRNFAWVKDSDI
jgi:hypothetical protein